MISQRTWCTTLLAAIALAAACKSSSTGPTVTQPSGTYKGTLVGSSVSGVLTVTFPAAASAAYTTGADGVAYSAMSPDAITITGSFTPTGGTAVPLNGSYDATKTPALSLSGSSGWAVIGSWSSTANSISGTFTGPSGTGQWAASGGTKAAVFCGTYGNGTSNSGAGTWNLVWDGGTSLLGVASSSSGALLLQGNLSSGSSQPLTLNVTFSGGVANGTLNTTTGTGSGGWSSGSNAGQWTTNTAAC